MAVGWPVFPVKATVGKAFTVRRELLTSVIRCAEHSAAHNRIDYFFRRFLEILSKALMPESTLFGIVSHPGNFTASAAIPGGGAETVACRTRPESDES